MNPHTQQRELYLKNEIKKYVAAWLRSYGQVQMGEECIEPLHQVIDNVHNEIIRKRKLPDRC